MFVHRKPQAVVAAAETRNASFFSSPVALPEFCTWYVLLASLDVMLTWVVLSAGGHEVNRVAAFFIDNYGLMGAVLLKMVTVVFVLGVIQYVARSDTKVARKIGMAAVALTAFPVVSAAIQLAVHRGHVILGI